MNRVGVALCCAVLACTTTIWKPPRSGDLHEGSEVFFVGTDRAVQIRNARPSGDRVEGDVVHVWRLPPGPMRVPMSTGDEPADVARRGGWQEDMNPPAVFVGEAAEVDRVRGTQDSHLGRFLLKGLVAVAIIAGAFVYAVGQIGPHG